MNFRDVLRYFQTNHQYVFNSTSMTRPFQVVSPSREKRQKGNVTTQTTPQKSSITQRLLIDFGRSVGVTTANQLV